MNLINPIPPSAVPVPMPGVKLISDDDNNILICELPWIQFKYELNAQSALIWKLCEHSASIADIEAVLMDWYPGERQDIALDLSNSLISFYRGNLISFVCNPDYLVDHTYHINLSRLLADELDKQGWRRARNDETAQFAFYQQQSDDIRVAKHQMFDLFLTQPMNAKHWLTERLATSGLDHWMPETYTSFEQFEQCSGSAEDSLWFLKLSFSGRQREVYCFQKHGEIRERINQFGNQSYVIQRAIANPMLVDGCKTTLRVYVLLLADKSVYVYHDGSVRIQSSQFNKLDARPETQFNHVDASRHPIQKYSQLNAAMPAIYEMVTEIMPLFIDDYCHQSQPEFYSLLGADIVVDDQSKPYLIEFNHTPGLRLENIDTAFYQTKVNMANDWLEIVLNNNRAAQIGGYLKIL